MSFFKNSKENHMKSKFLVRAVVLLIMAAFLVGCAGARPTGMGVDYQWSKGFAFLPIPVYVWGHTQNYDQWGQLNGALFSCWIWGEYWINLYTNHPTFFPGFNGWEVSSSGCKGVIKGGG
jgi:hypothetical protein